jgi:hypothetical protein
MEALIAAARAKSVSSDSVFSSHAVISECHYPAASIAEQESVSRD